jgi:hypothetical protein
VASETLDRQEESEKSGRAPAESELASAAEAPTIPVDNRTDRGTEGPGAEGGGGGGGDDARGGDLGSQLGPEPAWAALGPNAAGGAAALEDVPGADFSGYSPSSLPPPDEEEETSGNFVLEVKERWEIEPLVETSDPFANKHRFRMHAKKLAYKATPQPQAIATGLADSGWDGGPMIREIAVPVLPLAPPKAGPRGRKPSRKSTSDPEPDRGDSSAGSSSGAAAGASPGTGPEEPALAPRDDRETDKDPQHAGVPLRRTQRPHAPKRKKEEDEEEEEVAAPVSSSCPGSPRPPGFMVRELEIGERVYAEWFNGVRVCGRCISNRRSAEISRHQHDCLLLWSKEWFDGKIMDKHYYHYRGKRVKYDVKFDDGDERFKVNREASA